MRLHPLETEREEMNGKKLWKAARTWLEKNSPEGINKLEFDGYFSSASKSDRAPDMATLYRAILNSLTQAGMKKNVIVGAMKNGIDGLGVVTHKFSPAKTVKQYKNDHEKLFADIQTKVDLNRELREEEVLWPMYCKTILATGRFLSQFETSDGFFAWAEVIEENERLRIALPLILSEEIFGAGFALGCNVLIDLGFENFAKPDRHVKRILEGVHLMDASESDYQVLKTMFQLAGEAGVTPYALDKALFLIGSGDYGYFSLKGKADSVRDRTDRFLSFATDG